MAYHAIVCSGGGESARMIEGPFKKLREWNWQCIALPPISIIFIKYHYYVKWISNKNSTWQINQVIRLSGISRDCLQWRRRAREWLRSLLQSWESETDNASLRPQFKSSVFTSPIPEISILSKINFEQKSSTWQNNQVISFWGISRDCWQRRRESARVW